MRVEPSHAMHRLALLLALTSCATASGSIGGVRRGGGGTASLVNGDRGTDVIDCETAACGGTGNPMELSIGIAAVVGVVLVGLWKQR
jgi:hypothetical protein